MTSSRPPDDILELALDLRGRGEPFALATVVRCERPTSAKPGAKALVRQDGTLTGWVGGACAEPVVVREALEALRDGRPRLVGLFGDGAGRRGRIEGVREYAMTCHSGGTLEIYVEPYLARPLLILVGHGPVIEALATLGRATDYAVEVVPESALAAGLGRLSLTARTSVVVATHADSDEGALDIALRTDAGYVSLVASRRRATVIRETLTRRGVPAARVRALRAPAGLDIGARTPAEIAVSILAEIVQHHRRTGEVPPASDPVPSAATEATDPVCGMRVAVATARFRSDAAGRTVYFCCQRCQETFDQAPDHRRAALAAADPRLAQ